MKDKSVMQEVDKQVELRQELDRGEQVPVLLADKQQLPAIVHPPVRGI